jgi:Protein of unknown function (DUF1161)
MTRTLATLFAASIGLALVTAAGAEETAAPAAEKASSSAHKSCDDLKSEIAAKLDAKGVKGYTLTVGSPEDAAKDGKIVGSCDGGRQRVVYKRG